MRKKEREVIDGKISLFLSKKISVVTKNDKETDGDEDGGMCYDVVCLPTKIIKLPNTVKW